MPREKHAIEAVKLIFSTKKDECCYIKMDCAKCGRFAHFTHEHGQLLDMIRVLATEYFDGFPCVDTKT